MRNSDVERINFPTRPLMQAERTRFDQWSNDFITTERNEDEVNQYGFDRRKETGRSRGQRINCAAGLSGSVIHSRSYRSSAFHTNRRVLCFCMFR